MFTLDKKNLEALGAHITTAEIAQQPELWEDTLNIYQDNLAEIEAFLGKAKELAQGSKVRVVFTGAGTSAYVSDTVVPYLRKVGDLSSFSFENIATTDIVCSPLSYLLPEEPTILVSFARSGNSPESVAAVKLAKQVVKNLLCLNITCAPEGRLAQDSKGDDRALTLLIPRANDKGFAMTGSYSCMLLLSSLIFDTNAFEAKAAWVKEAACLGRELIEREAEAQALIDLDFDRVTYLGSASLSGLAREAQLKILELCAGKVATSFDSSMGYRHGPKSFVNDKTLVFVFVSNDAYTRQYDLDILREIAGDEVALKTVSVDFEATDNFEGTAVRLKGEALPDAYAALPFVLFAQTISLLASVKVGNTPDTPSANGTVNRVVKGVTIHDFA